MLMSGFFVVNHKATFCAIIMCMSAYEYTVCNTLLNRKAPSIDSKWNIKKEVPVFCEPCWDFHKYNYITYILVSTKWKYVVIIVICMFLLHVSYCTARWSTWWEAALSTRLFIIIVINNNNNSAHLFQQLHWLLFPERVHYHQATLN